MKRSMRKAMSLLMALILVLLLFPASVFAANDGMRSGWTEISDEISLAYFLSEGGRGYLSEDVKVSDYLFVYGREEETVNVVLDLCGHVIEGLSPDKYSPIYVEEGCSLTMTDSRPRAEHSGDYASLPRGGVVYYNHVLAADGMTDNPACITNRGNLTVNGGSYIGKATGGDAENEGDYAVVFNNSGSLSINSGTIEASTTSAAAMLVSNISGGTLTVNGGTFSCESDAFAQCIVATGTAATMTTVRGGRFKASATDGNAGVFVSFAGKWNISGCEATAAGKKYASAFFIADENTDAAIRGGSFKATATGDEVEVYGIANNGGTVTALGGSFRVIGKGARGIYQGGTMTVGGSLQVTSTAENLYLAEGKTVTVKNPVDMKRLSVVLESGTGDITAPGSSNYSRFFTSADSKCQIKNTGRGAAQVVKVIARGTSRTETGSYSGRRSVMARAIRTVTGWLLGEWK